MSSIKLTADSGGGTFEIKAPSSSGNTRVLTLPDTKNLTLNGGRILQVVKVTQESVTSWATTTYADISGLTATINGVTSGSKIIVDFNLILGCSHDTHFLFKLFRDSTFLPAFSGASMSLTHYPADFSNAQYLFDAVSLRFVDTHGQSEGSNLVYKLQGANDGSSGYVQYLNRRHYDSTQRGQSLMTLTEVAA